MSLSRWRTRPSTHGRLNIGAKWKEDRTAQLFIAVALPGKTHFSSVPVTGLLTAPRRVLFFPHGNNCEFASFYLEQGYEDKPPENWYRCVQFGLVLWNPNDPSIHTTHRESARIPVCPIIVRGIDKYLAFFRGTSPLHRRGRRLGIH